MGYSSAHLVTSTLRIQIRLQHPNSSEPGHVPHCWRAHSPAPAPSSPGSSTCHPGHFSLALYFILSLLQPGLCTCYSICLKIVPSSI